MIRLISVVRFLILAFGILLALPVIAEPAPEGWQWVLFQKGDSFDSKLRAAGLQLIADRCAPIIKFNAERVELLRTQKHNAGLFGPGIEALKCSAPLSAPKTFLIPIDLETHQERMKE
ncbi:MAG: hypothetical protein JNM27_18485 [Leptospirales bacterium]|nr:hypothetical protein [Leptospirales bacterium]